MILLNLQIYEPSEMPYGDDIQYYIDSTGKDWFESLPLFTKSHSIAFHPETGEIHSHCENTSNIYPVGMNITDIDSLPDGFGMGLMRWMFDGEKIVKMPTDDVLEASNRRDSEMVTTTIRIDALVEAQDDGDITPEEESELTMLRARRSALRRQTPASNAPELPSLS